MHFEQFYLGCLAHASYLIASTDEAAIVDPQRDVEVYLAAAKKIGVPIRHIFETHLHADFVSGHRELAERTGATMYIGSKAEATYPHVPLADGFELRMGDVKIRALETPGHTIEGISLVVTDETRSARPYAVITGDTLFIGDVGRPDLSKRHSPEQLAGMLFDSLHGKLLALPDETLVYPAHGAGSLCGRNMRAETSSTIGTERLTNYALQIKDRDEFIRQLTSNLPARPEYFSQDAAINRAGAPALDRLPALVKFSPDALAREISQGAIALDVRPSGEFCEEHVPGSINIALSGQFASWAAILLTTAGRPILIASTTEQVEEARLRLARVGIEAPAGYLEGNFAAWKAQRMPTAATAQISVEALAEARAEGVAILDVRRQAERQSMHIGGSNWWPLDNFMISPPQIDQKTRVAVHCKSGYRSVIACSLLQRAGFTDVINVSGGFDAWLKALLPTVNEATTQVE